MCRRDPRPWRLLNTAARPAKPPELGEADAHPPAVVEAVGEGRFHVFAVATVEDALELLTGTPAGARRADGAFPEGSVNHRIDARLRAMAEAARRLHGGSAMDGSADRAAGAAQAHTSGRHL